MEQENSNQTPKTLTQRLVRMLDSSGTAIYLNPKHVSTVTPYRNSCEQSVVGTENGTYAVVHGDPDKVVAMIEGLAKQLGVTA